MIDAAQIDDNFAQIWVSVNAAQGLDERMAYIKLYKALIKSAEKNGNDKEADIYREYLDQLQ